MSGNRLRPLIGLTNRSGDKFAAGHVPVSVAGQPSVRFGLSTTHLPNSVHGVSLTLKADQCGVAVVDFRRFSRTNRTASTVTDTRNKRRILRHVKVRQFTKKS